MAIALQRKWAIVSPTFVTKAINDKCIPPIEGFCLNLNKVKSAPQTSSVHVVARTVEETHFKRSGAFSDLKKSLQANSNGEKRPQDVVNCLSCKKSHKKKRLEPLKRKPNAYMMFVKERSQQIREQLDIDKENITIDKINRETAQQWSKLSIEEKEAYRSKGIEYFSQYSKTLFP